MRSSSFRKKVALDPLEVRRVLDELQASSDISGFALGDRVKVNSGPFLGLLGTVEGLESATLRLSLNVFGKATPVELSPVQVEKL